MFNVKRPVEDVLRWLGRSLDARQHAALERFATWLEEEAITAGGLGPNEAQRVPERHIGNSLSFLTGLRPNTDTVLDIGSGAGLPGIPLAIALPGTDFTLLDRSQRRVDLAARAVRVLGLPNVAVVAEDVADHDGRYSGVVMRAVFPPKEAIGIAQRFIEDAGVGLIGIGRETAATPPAPPPGWSLQQIRVPVLDSPATILRITRA